MHSVRILQTFQVLHLQFTVSSKSIHSNVTFTHIHFRRTQNLLAI